MDGKYRKWIYKSTVTVQLTFTFAPAICIQKHGICCNHLNTENVNFRNSQLDHNHHNSDFCLEGKIKHHKMLVPKGSISNDV